MPRSRLTQAAVDRLKLPPEGRVIHWDATLPSFGLRLSARGKRTWIAMYRIRGGKQVQQTLNYAKTPNITDAREWARGLMAAAERGQDPDELRREEEARNLSFAAAAARYMAEYVERNCRPKTIGETRRILTRDVLPLWGDMPIREIGRLHVNDLLDNKAAKRDRPRKGYTEGAAAQANRTLARLRTLFGWAKSMELVDTDPTEGVRKRLKEVPRDRVLSESELIAFWTACDHMGWPYGPLFQLLLLTAQRREEVNSMRWSELDLDKGVWTIPRERAKSDRAHDVHLAPLALEILQDLPRLAGPGFVFTTLGDRPLNGHSKSKARLDKLMGGDNTQPWTLHDLRRTAASGMAKLNVLPHVVDKILNHSTGTIRGVARIYNRHSYEAERRAALDTWSRHIESLVYPERASNVVALSREAWGA